MLSGGKGEGWSEKGKKEPDSVNWVVEACSITKRGCEHFGGGREGKLRIDCLCECTSTINEHPQQNKEMGKATRVAFINHPLGMDGQK